MGFLCCSEKIKMVGLESGHEIIQTTHPWKLPGSGSSPHAFTNLSVTCSNFGGSTTSAAGISLIDEPPAFASILLPLSLSSAMI